MKKIYFKIFSIFLGLILGYCSIFLIFFFSFDKHFVNTIKSKEKFEIINKYRNVLNHVRSYNHETSDLVYSSINKYNLNNRNILFQGDSWYEQINFPANDFATSYENVNLENNSPENYKTLNFLREWTSRRSVGAINGGTGSYSPSLMSIQLEILESDFNIKPNFVIAYIDQTDLGDENCRYKDNKIFKDKKLISVGNSKSLGKNIFNYNKILKFSEINLSSNSKFYKVHELMKFYLLFETNKFFKINSYKISQVLDKGWSGRKISTCNLGEILNYLVRPTDEAIDYFKISLNEYLLRASKKKHISKIYLVTFPHLEHLKKIYDGNGKFNLNISNVVDEVLKNILIPNKDKIKHINFSKIITKDNKIFKYEDYIFDNMHLKQRAHKQFLEETLKNVDNF